MISYRGINESRSGTQVDLQLMNEQHESQENSLEIRPATSDDRQGVIDLIATCYAEYDDKVCLDGAEQELLEIPQAYHKIGGQFWVLSDQQGTIFGSHAAYPENVEQRVAGFKRLYLDQSLRGGVWSQRLMQVTIDWSWANNFHKIEFWSDTRFERAHCFFGKFGFKKDGRVREMFDSHDPYSEFYFSLLNPGQDAQPDS